MNKNKKLKIVEIIQQDKAIKDFLLLRARILRNEYNIETVFISWPGKYAKEINNEFKVIEVPFSRKFNFIKDYKAILKIKSILEEIKPDFVHTHFTKPGFIGRIASKKAGVPITIHQVHGFYFDRFQKSFKRFIFEKLEKYLAENFTDYIFFQNKDNFKYAMENFKLEKDRLIYLGNGIDLKKYNFSPKPLSKNFRFVSIGRLENIKNHVMTIKAVEILVEKYKVNNFTLEIIGEGPLRKELEKSVKIKKLENYITFLGHKDNIPELLKKYDALILTSLSEGKPRVVMEAMASGVFVIATDVIGTRDLVINNETGFTVPLNDSEAVAEKMKVFMNLEQEVKMKILLNARKKIEEECDEEKIAKKIGIFLLERSGKF